MPREADVPYFNYRKGSGDAWRVAAVCGPVGTKHPWNAIGPGSRAAITVGKTICLDLCPVRAQCLGYAITAEIMHGTWGGMTESERAKMSALQRQRAIDMGRMSLYDARLYAEQEECTMVVVIAKAKFIPTLAVGEIGEVEDTLARAAVRNGYADLVGKAENFDDWMYHGAELKVTGRTLEGESAKKTAKKPRRSMVEPSTALESA